MKILKQYFGFISTVSCIGTDIDLAFTFYRKIYHNTAYSSDRIDEFVRFNYRELRRTIFEGSILQQLGF